MSDETKTLLALGVRRIFTVIGAWLASKGLIHGDPSGFVGACMVLAEVAYEGWNRYGMVLVNAQLAKMKGVHPAQNPTPPAPPSAAVKALAIFAVLLASLIFAMPAMAANGLTLVKPALTGNLAKDLKTDASNAAAASATSTAAAGQSTVDKILAALAKPFQDLATFIGDDDTAAVALSTAIPSLQDGHGQQCWIAMQQFSAVVKAHPVPITLKIATDLEALRLSMMAANNLCANPHCTQVFADLSNGVQQLAPTNVSIAIPSLNSICSKVPQIALAPPVSAPPPTATATTPVVPQQ